MNSVNALRKKEAKEPINSGLTFGASPMPMITFVIPLSGCISCSALCTHLMVCVLRILIPIRRFVFDSIQFHWIPQIWHCLLVRLYSINQYVNKSMKPRTQPYSQLELKEIMILILKAGIIFYHFIAYKDLLYKSG